MLHPMKGSIVDKLLGYLAMCLAFVLTLDIVFIQLVNFFNYLLSLWLNPLLKHSNTGLINETSEMISVFAQNQDWRSSSCESIGWLLSSTRGKLADWWKANWLKEFKNRLHSSQW